MNHQQNLNIEKNIKTEIEHTMVMYNSDYLIRIEVQIISPPIRICKYQTSVI